MIGCGRRYNANHDLRWLQKNDRVLQNQGELETNLPNIECFTLRSHGSDLRNVMVQPEIIGSSLEAQVADTAALGIRRLQL